MKGKAEKNSTVTVTTPSGATCTTTADANGDYSCELSPEPEDGEDITVVTEDAAGNKSTPTVVTGGIDTQAPAVLGTPQVAGAPSTNNTQPAITGSGCIDGDTVTVYVDGTAITPTAVCTNGSYSITPETPLSEGNHEITVTSKDDAGNESIPSEKVKVAIDLTAPEEPTVLTPTNGAPVSGNAEPNATVTVTTPSGATCTTTADASGNYACELSPTPLNGDDITVVAEDNAGNTSTPMTVPAGIDLQAPSVLGAPTVAGAPSTNITNPTITGGGCTEGDIVTVYIDGSAVTPTAVCTGGTYTITPDIILAEGNHEIAVTSTDGVGNQSTLSAATTVTIDTTVPKDPTIDEPLINPVTGEGEVGSTITVTTQSGAKCTTTVKADGTYSCELSPIPEKGELITVVSEDASGNKSQPVTSTGLVYSRRAEGEYEVKTALKGGASTGLGFLSLFGLAALIRRRFFAIKK